jgi:hypothetical protein
LSSGKHRAVGRAFADGMRIPQGNTVIIRKDGKRGKRRWIAVSELK